MKLTKSKLKQIIKEEINNVNEIDIFGTQRKGLQIEVGRCGEKLKATQQAALKALKTIQSSVQGGKLKTLVDEIVMTFERDHGPGLFAQSDADFARTGEDPYRTSK